MDAIQEIEQLYENRGSITGLPTGFVELDRMTSGLHPAEGSGSNFKKGRRADPGALGERESLACQIGPKFKLCTRTFR
jgi:hypothetical protein